VETSCQFYIAGDKLALALLTHYFCIFPGWKRRCLASEHRAKTAMQSGC
jgi:hypothetical protein